MALWPVYQYFRNKLTSGGCSRSDSSKMKIFFSGSMSRSSEDVELYHKHVRRLEKFGQVVNKEVVGKGDAESKTDVEIFNLNMERLKSADVLVAEVTQPSLGVGYEIGIAVSLKKKVLCMFRPEIRKALSPNIAGSDNGVDFIVKYYKDRESDAVFKSVFEEWCPTGSSCESKEDCAT